MADKAQSPGEGSDTWDIIEFELNPFVSVTLDKFFSWFPIVENIITR